jgi:hypothetical protein
MKLNIPFNIPVGFTLYSLTTLRKYILTVHHPLSFCSSKGELISKGPNTTLNPTRRVNFVAKSKERVDKRVCAIIMIDFLKNQNRRHGTR